MNLYYVEFAFDPKQGDKPDGKYVVAENMSLIENFYPNVESVELSEKNIEMLGTLKKKKEK